MIHQHVGHRSEEFAEQGIRVRPERGVVERAIHELQPPVTRVRRDREGHVPHPQARMPALLHVTRGAAETADKEVTQALLGAGKIVGRIHRPKDGVGRHLPVKRRYQATKAVFADRGVDFMVFHSGQFYLSARASRRGYHSPVRPLTVIGAITFALFASVHAQQRPLMLSQLTWFDRSGKSLGTVGPLGDHGNIELSPDGSRIASALGDKSTGARDIWVYGVTGGGSTRLTSSSADENWMVWSADGTRAVLNAFSQEMFDLFEMPARSDGAHRRLAIDEAARWPVSLSPDGRYLLYVTNNPRTGNDIWVLPMTGGQQAYPFQHTAAAENWATFSPDGRFVAFSSTESGSAEVLVTPFPGPGPKWRVSADTGIQARWRSADELIYIDGDGRLIATSLSIADNVVTPTAFTPLFEIKYPYGAYHAFDVTRDGQRILVNTTVLSGRNPGVVADSRITASESHANH